jgi:tetratricopeptide (TPR) repeat protein
MKISASLTLILFLTGFISLAQHDRMPLTSSSGSAVKLYLDFFSEIEKAELASGEALLNEALKKDPEFFMGLFQKAINHLHSGDQDKFRKCAESAFISCCATSEGEKILQEALRKLYENQNANVTDLGRRLIQLYPADKIVFYQQIAFQTLIKDYKGIDETCNSLLKITDNPAPVYNLMGYNYMHLKDFTAAEKAFDEYIELLPNHPNPYDSKGDFYMQVKDYPKAWSSYMTANRINESWSYEKALKAKELIEQ